MATVPETKSDASAETAEPSYDEAAIDRQIDRMVEKIAARLPAGYDFDWERGAVVRLDPSLPKRPWCDHD